MCTKNVEHGFHRVFEPANHKIHYMVKIKNVGRKAFCGRHHKENVGRKTFRDRHQKNNVKPYRGMTMYEIQQIILGWAAFALRVLNLLVELLKG